MTKPTIDQGQLWRDLMTMGRMGALPLGGCDRLTLTDADRDGRNLFRMWCEEAGLTVTVDMMGNIFGRREGSDPTLAPVMAGSHLDTQSPGGKFDGVLGVLGALAAVRGLNQAGIVTRRTIEIVAWTNEEGARFSPGLMGSAVFAGRLSLEAAHAAVDRKGKSFGAELRRIRYHGDTPVGGRPVDTYLELHIEQGPELEAQGITIAGVTRSHFSAYATIECLGENAHSQTTPMARRRNALVGAARVVAEIDRIGQAFAPDGKASATVMDIWPNNRINIPHRAAFAAIMVHPEEAGISAMRAALKQALEVVAAETGLTFHLPQDSFRAPVHLSLEMVALIEAVSRDLGHSVTRLETLTGHDAFNMVELCPTGLIFVPCKDGISHSELEYASPEDCAAGAEVLMHALLRRADRN
jgi:N-carbamoyl-L-amino-acid hydrolase